MTVVDPIDLEVLRSRLDAIGEQSAAAVEQTAISPVVTESKDYSFTLLDANGGLIIGAGQIEFHFGAASHAVKATIATHGETIAPGDVFLANDPHAGGGLHPQDVMVQRPIFLRDRRIAWVVISAHLMDLGGMVVGSFAPAATECFQEALRLPPVRLFRGGEEQSDVWAIFRNNVRLHQLVEMDLRSLVAGCHVAQERVSAVVDALGEGQFVDSLRAIRDLSEQQMRRRISEIADGTYRATSWTEFDDELFEVPCTLSVQGDQMVFDFAGASPQTSHFFNSKPYIIESEFVAQLADLLAQDLPYNEGIFAPVQLRCPEGTIVNAQPPAPIAAAHMHVSLNAAEVAMQTVRLAIGASDGAPARRYLTGWGFESGIGIQTWSWVDAHGVPDAFMVMDGNWAGGAAGLSRDGLDLGRNLVGSDIEGSFIDIEILESWYPLLFTERRARPSVEGAGEHRAGGGAQMGLRPWGVDQVAGTTFGMRRWVPLEGGAGGLPGPCTQFIVHHRDGSSDYCGIHSSSIVVAADDTFQFRLASGGGYGDPLDRDPESVATDVRTGRFGAEAAADSYGVVFGSDGAVDRQATERRRAEARSERLAKAQPPAVAVTEPQPGTERSSSSAPLYPGVVQRGPVAYAEHSGSVLAVAPHHWTDGCPILQWRSSPDGPDIRHRAYLDPATGRMLHVEVVPAEGARNFSVMPARWAGANP